MGSPLVSVPVGPCCQCPPTASELSTGPSPSTHEGTLISSFITRHPSLLAGQRSCYAPLSATPPDPSTTADPGTCCEPPPGPSPSPPESRSPRHAPAPQQHGPDQAADTHQPHAGRRQAGRNCQMAGPSGPSHLENLRQLPTRLTDHSRPH